MTTYTCAECGAAVTVHGGEVVARSCSHTGTITAHLQASVSGVSSLA